MHASSSSPQAPYACGDEGSKSKSCFFLGNNTNIGHRKILVLQAPFQWFQGRRGSRPRVAREAGASPAAPKITVMGAGLLILSLGLLASGLTNCLTRSQPTRGAKPTQTAATLIGGTQKVKVTVFYEPYCKNSARFLKKQLIPVYGQLREHLIIELVPFGRASMNEPQGSVSDVIFVFPHGHDECRASRIHACAMNLYPDPDKYLPFIACTFKGWKHEKNIAVCSSANKMEAARITGCTSWTQGKVLLRGMGLRTMSLEPSINHVPSVVIDGNFDNRHQAKLQKHFKNTVCKHFKAPLPEPCLVKKRRGWFRR